jgi:acetoin utilization protein AcuB
MTKPIPTVGKYMTTSPHTIGAEQNLAHAHALLRAHHIRHLPVLRAGDLVGMLTERDLALIETLKDVDPREVEVEEAMSTDVYVVSPATPLREAATTMWKKKLGSAVVMDGRQLVGVFTPVDARRAPGHILRAPSSAPRARAGPGHTERRRLQRDLRARRRLHV